MEARERGKEVEEELDHIMDETIKRRGIKASLDIRDKYENCQRKALTESIWEDHMKSATEVQFIRRYHGKMLYRGRE